MLLGTVTGRKQGEAESEAQTKPLAGKHTLPPPTYLAGFPFPTLLYLTHNCLLPHGNTQEKVTLPSITKTHQALAQ